MTGSVRFTPESSELARQALTHRSAGRPNNERLEFFGDSLLGLIISEQLFQRLPRADEGQLTRLRAALVREATLSQVARRLHLGEHIRLGPGELKSGGHRRDSILADALEALIAADYLEHGFDAARRRVLEWFAPELEALDAGEPKDAKTRLQEWLQARQLPLPEYQVVQARGAEHEREFEVRCLLAQPLTQAHGAGLSRKAAEQAAAEAALRWLESNT